MIKSNQTLALFLLELAWMSQNLLELPDKIGERCRAAQLQTPIECYNEELAVSPVPGWFSRLESWTADWLKIHRLPLPEQDKR
jgi:hypothetical protein